MARAPFGRSASSSSSGNHNAWTFPSGLLTPAVDSAQGLSDLQAKELVELLLTCDMPDLLARDLVVLVAEYTSAPSLDVAWELAGDPDRPAHAELSRTVRVLTKIDARNCNSVAMQPALSPGAVWKISVRFRATRTIGPYIGVSPRCDELEPGVNIGFSPHAVSMNWWSTTEILTMFNGRGAMRNGHGHFPKSGFDFSLLVDLSRPGTRTFAFNIACDDELRSVSFYEWDGGPLYIVASLLREGECVEILRVEDVTFDGPWW